MRERERGDIDFDCERDLRPAKMHRCRLPSGCWLLADGATLSPVPRSPPIFRASSFWPRAVYLSCRRFWARTARWVCGAQKMSKQLPREFAVPCWIVSLWLKPELVRRKCCFILESGVHPVGVAPWLAGDVVEIRSRRSRSSVIRYGNNLFVELRMVVSPASGLQLLAGEN